MPAELLRNLMTIEGWLDEAEAEHLFALAAEVRGACIVEVGSYRGRSTAVLAFGSMAGGGARVYAIEPHEAFTGVYGGKFGPVDRGVFCSNMSELGLWETVRLVNLSSEVVAPNWPHPVGLLWVDGDHRYEGVRRDFECWRPRLRPGASVVFDDALDPEIGPARLIEELQTEGWQRARVVGKTVTLEPPR